MANLSISILSDHIHHKGIVLISHLQILVLKMKNEFVMQDPSSTYNNLCSFIE